MKQTKIEEGEVLVTIAYLESKGVAHNTAKTHFKRKKAFKIYTEDGAFLPYDDLSDYIKSLLPSKEEIIASLKENDFDAEVEKHNTVFLRAKTTDWIKHREMFRDIGCLTDEKIRLAAQRVAYWVYIERLTKEGYREVAKIYKALCQVEPNLYKSYNVFNNKKSEVMRDGIEAALFDNRWLTSRHNVKKISALNQYWVTGLVGIGKKYSNRKVWEMLCEMCAKAKEPAPSKSWVDKFRKEILRKNIAINASRNGKEASSAKKLTYASIQHALHANSQWQMDGWTLPFWVDGFKRYVIVFVIDAHSKKIIGSAVGETENTITIMAALRDAIINTGFLPFEIVTDNHAWNRTKEAGNFKDMAAAIGTQYTVTSRPTRKAIVETRNRPLDRLCRDYYGYIGEGIKSKNIDAHPNQEFIDQYAKNPITGSEVMLIGAKIVFDFNNQLNKEGKSPNQLYEESDKPKCFPVNIYERIKLLTAKTQLKVTRGQINITRGKKYEYQLPAELYSTYDGKIVTVRYEDLNECIYLYDSETDKAITELAPKAKIHGAIADHTDEDIKLLNQNKGRITGIQSQAKKEVERMTCEALEANPEAYAYLNQATTPKNIVKEFQEKAELKRLAQDKGISLHTAYVPDRESEMDNESLVPVKKTNESPYKPKNHVMKKVSRKDFYED